MDLNVLIIVLLHQQYYMEIRVPNLDFVYLVVDIIMLDNKYKVIIIVYQNVKALILIMMTQQALKNV